ncbi:hypothetical protein EJ04DRAFT_489711, partial [Polyplosphaeria fusca]
MALDRRQPSRLHLVLFITLLIACPCLAITIFPSNTEPRAYNHESLPSATFNSQDLFSQSCPDEFQTHPNASVLFSSNEDALKSGTVYPSSDSFVRGAIDAWAQHQHLVIRPDEVWFSILAQMNFYMTKNAEMVRHLFVNHKGKQNIVVKNYTVEAILRGFTEEIQARVKTPWLKDWVMPNFSTTTDDDTLTASVLMMGLMKAYFNYIMQIICGIPSITLSGEKADWERLLTKLDRLNDFGKEPRAFAEQLRPIFKRFVETFDKPDDPTIRQFWNSIIHAEGPSNICGTAPYTFTGWLMGFFFWDSEGKPLFQSKYDDLVVDGVHYSPRSIEDLPIAYAQAPVTILKFQEVEEFKAYLLAGNLGKQIDAGVPNGYTEALKRFNGSETDLSLPHGTLRPLSGWAIYGPVDHSKKTNKWPGGSEIGVLETIMDRTWTPMCHEPDKIHFQNQKVVFNEKHD